MLKRGIFLILHFGRQANGGVGNSPLFKLLFFDSSPPKNVIYNNFFNLIKAIQINKLKCSFVFPASKIAFINFRQHNYLHLHRMSKNYLNRTLIFLLPKVYSVQTFIQHIVTNNVTIFQKTFYSMFYQIDTFFVRNRTTVYRRAARIWKRGGGAFLKEWEKCKWPWPEFSLFLNQLHTVCPKTKTEFLGNLGNSNVFSAQNQVVSKKNKGLRRSWIKPSPWLRYWLYIAWGLSENAL